MTLTVSILHFVLVFVGGERSLSGNDTLPGHCMESSASHNTLFKVLLLWENSWVVLQHPILRLHRGEQFMYALSWSHLCPAMISHKNTSSFLFALHIWSWDHSYWSFFGFKLLCTREGCNCLLTNFIIVLVLIYCPWVFKLWEQWKRLYHLIFPLFVLIIK